MQFNFLKMVKGYKKIVMFLLGALTVFLQDTVGFQPEVVESIVSLCSFGIVGQGVADAGQFFQNFKLK